MSPAVIYLISYPRSGSTLCRTYFSILQGRPQLSAYRGDVLLPEAGPLTDALAGVRLIKSHHFSPVYERVVYLVRDGRNAMISHLYLQFLHGGHSYRSPRDVLAGLQHLDAEGHFWGDHVSAALRPVEESEVCFVRYEDLICDPVAVLARISEFAGSPVPAETLRECVTVASRSEAYSRSFASGHQHRPEPGSIWERLHAHREGDYWREIFDAGARRWFHERGGTPHLLRFGYEHTESWWRSEEAD
jgi:hypothetical protein